MNCIGRFKRAAQTSRQNHLAHAGTTRPAATPRQGTLGQSSDKWGDRRPGDNDGMGNGECGLIWHT